MIVQCPSCSTKFSVEAETIDKVSNPRFHCSRCDTYFDLLGKPKRSATKSTLKSDDSPVEQLSLLPASDPKEPENPRVARSRELLAEDADGSDGPAITAAWPDSFAETALEADMRSALDAAGVTGAPDSATDIRYGDLSIRRAGRFRPVIETKSTLISTEDEPSPAGSVGFAGSPDFAGSMQGDSCSSKASSTVSAALSAREPLNEFTRATTELERPSESNRSIVPFPRTRSQGTASFGTVGGTAAGDGTSAVRSRRDPELEDLPLRGVVGGSSARDGHVSRAVGRLRLPLQDVRGLALTLAFPLALLLLFGWWSVSFDGTPEAVAALARVQLQELPRLAPAGLQLVGVQAEDVPLDNGRRLLQVSGSLLNSTDHAYRDIFIEAKLFDRQNKKIGTLVVPASSGLSTAGALTSLAPDSISELQARTGIGRPLRPAENVPFRLIFTEVPSDAVWYAARVYSVKPATM